MCSYETPILQNLKFLFLLRNVLLLLTETRNSEESSSRARVIGRDSPSFQDDQELHQNGPIQTASVNDQQCQFPLLDAPSASTKANSKQKDLYTPFTIVQFQTNLHFHCTENGLKIYWSIIYSLSQFSLLLVNLLGKQTASRAYLFGSVEASRSASNNTNS